MYLISGIVKYQKMQVSKTESVSMIDLITK